MTTMEERSPNDTTIKDRTTLDVSITEDRTTTNMTDGGSNRYNANKNTIIIAVTAQRVSKEGARGERVHSKRAHPRDKQHTAHRERYSRRVHKPGGGDNIMSIVAGSEELSYTPTIVAA